ncbi:MAG: hypothetical protein KKE30_12250 [Gammaproteobacteria bacterium]|nr:hypothetical protein [Gammaproteobacteria bacterium]MBU1554804.1 hypothetical protein [Gammaproteobacteria bacterium]MBU2070276.1 hypothetical protein [Gammaproteobacteria bacterium]MBU2183979.1 hypothetical protein [Gammaproteobacteria bacterium]MBU2206783.1 hypothetical protein [Gammaproteobacteria bacterium]
MSYDLFMKPRNGDFSKRQFDSYFWGRKNYTLDGSQAWYQNEVTGVYFVFEYQEHADDDNEEYFPIAFNMNYFRPTFFVKEAEPEVREFIIEFDLKVDDPQTHGMGSGDFNSEKFTSGWLYGNEFGYQSILKDHPEVITLPTEQLEAVWSWNIQKERLQEEVEEDVFVPSIMVLNYKGRAVTACVWPDAIPSIIPPVDILLIGRNELAPRRLFKKVEDMAIGPWSDIQPLLERHKSKMQGQAYYLFYQSVPTEIRKCVQSLKPVDRQTLARLSIDQVLNRELVKKYVA